MLTVACDGGLHKPVDACSVLLRVDGMQITRSAHNELPGHVDLNDVVYQVEHDAVDAVYVICNILVGHETIRVFRKSFL